MADEDNEEIEHEDQTTLSLLSGNKMSARC